jgi:four helix bundle protein
MDLVKEIYRITAGFPPSELYGLTSQMRRAAVSIPSNIAEGAARNGTKEFIQFLAISRGSLSELETQLLIAIDLGYTERNSQLMDTIDRLFGLLGGLMKSLHTRSST